MNTGTLKQLKHSKLNYLSVFMDCRGKAAKFFAGIMKFPVRSLKNFLK